MITDFNLTKRERDILQILWKNEDGMIASDFPKVREDLTINTVHAVLKKLLKKELIKVKEIVYSGSVLSRKYVASMPEEEFTVTGISQSICKLDRFGISPAKFFTEFLAEAEMTDEDADELLKFIEDLKKK